MSTTEIGASAHALPKGVGAFVEPVADLALKQGFDVNSWFTIGHFDVDGEVLNVLYHIMISPMPDGGRAIQACVSITNESTGWYSADDIVIPLDQATIADTGFDIEMPNGRIWGTLDKLGIRAALADGNGEFEIEAHATSPAILNGGTGVFPLVSMAVHQYSVPRLAGHDHDQRQGASGRRCHLVRPPVAEPGRRRGRQCRIQMDLDGHQSRQR